LKSQQSIGLTSVPGGVAGKSDITASAKWAHSRAAIGRFEQRAMRLVGAVIGGSLVVIESREARDDKDQGKEKVAHRDVLLGERRLSYRRYPLNLNRLASLQEFESDAYWTGAISPVAK